MTHFDIPHVGSARVLVLPEGYLGLDGDDERVSGTVTLSREQLLNIATETIPRDGAPSCPSAHA